jgi:hypothetical protein
VFVQSGGNGRDVELVHIKVALAKIRKAVPASSSLREGWDGWIPARDVDIYCTRNEEVFANSNRDLVCLLNLGWTLGCHNFQFEWQDLEKVNVITSVKGSGKIVSC